MTDSHYDLGLLGGGQLARMTIQAAQKMGLKCVSLDPAENSPASQVAPAIVGKLDDVAAISKLAESCYAITLENEFIPADSLKSALSGKSVVQVPSTNALQVIQDKLAQRVALSERSVPSPLAMVMKDPVEDAERALGYPMMLKARFGGYDGKGTVVAIDRNQLEKCRELWQNGGWLAEKFVPFSRELATMVVRTPTTCLHLPVMETYQPKQVCEVTLPADIRHVPKGIGTISIDAVKAVGGYGLFGVEMFELQNGAVLVNEIAPRPHNSGHYTLDWGRPSQFELHVRAVLGLSMPSEEESEGLPVAMVNLFGIDGAKDFRNGLKHLLAVEPCARFHWYQKDDPKPGRKMGHVNLDLNNLPEDCIGADAIIKYMLELRSVFEEGWRS